MKYRDRAHYRQKRRWAKRMRKYEWNPWFAWRPVSMDLNGQQVKVWLEWVERKFVAYRYSGWWEYRNNG